VRTRQWKRVEYDRLVDAGFFQPGDKVELIGGQLMVASDRETGWRYAEIRRCGREAAIAPIAAPTALIPVAALLL